MPNFTIEGRRIKNLPDIQRAYLWEIVISNVADLIDIGATDLEDDIIIRARTSQIPARGFETIESNFIGMTQLFPGRPTFGRTLALTLEETEDQLIHKFLYEWRQQIYDVNPNSPTAGVASKATKREMTRTIYLNMYHVDGNILDRRIKFWNAWPSDVSDIELSYDASTAVSYAATFSFDFWTSEPTA